MGLNALKDTVKILPAEKEIIEGCINGEKEAVEQLYNLYIKRMKGLIYRYARTTFDVEDILQEGFIRVFKNLGSFQGNGSFEGWVKRIMINTAINYYKKHLKFESEVSFEKIREADLDAIEIADNMSVQELHGMINRMPEGYRFVLNLYAIDGYSHKEIAEMLNIEENTSSSQYSRAKKYLSRLIKESL